MDEPIAEVKPPKRVGGVNAKTVLFREKVNNVMVECGGNRQKAAKMLGMTVRLLNIKLNTCEILRARWAVIQDTPPDATKAINRDIVNYKSLSPEQVSKLSSADLELDKAMRAQDEKVRNGLAKMGLSPEEIQIAQGCQQFGEGFYRESLQIIGGGATKTAILIQKQIGFLDKRLADVRQKLGVNGSSESKASNEERQFWVKEELGLLQGLALMSAEARRMMEVGFKSALIRAQIEKNGAERMKRPKPGFVVDVREEPGQHGKNGELLPS